MLRPTRYTAERARGGVEGGEDGVGVRGIIITITTTITITHHSSLITHLHHLPSSPSYHGSQALVTMMRSWTGILCLTSDKNVRQKMLFVCCFLSKFTLVYNFPRVLIFTGSQESDSVAGPSTISQGQFMGEGVCMCMSLR